AARLEPAGLSGLPDRRRRRPARAGAGGELWDASARSSRNRRGPHLQPEAHQMKLAASFLLCLLATNAAPSTATRPVGRRARSRRWSATGTSARRAVTRG